MKKEITIPTTLKDITLEQYQLFMQYVEDSDDKDFIDQKVVEILCNVEDASIITFNAFQDILEILNKTLGLDPVFQNKFKHDGIKYGFIPNLEQISLGEYVDLSNYLSDVQNYHKALAIMYRPIVKEKKGLYDIEPYQNTDNADRMKTIPLGIMFGAQVFFYNLAIELKNCILNYSMRSSRKKDISPKKKHLPKNGIGTPVSLN